jgi:hypothetical protein
VYTFLANLTTILPATIGITIGRNPSGSLHELFQGYRLLLAKARPVLAGGVAIEVIVYVLALTKTLDNWWFGIITAVLLFLLPTFGQILMPAAMRPDGAPTREPEPVWERVGIDEPYTVAIRKELDRRLALPAPAMPATLGPPDAVAAGHRNG